MYDRQTKSFSKFKSLDALEDLGQVQMIFTDKTGTLTKNKLTLKKM